MATAAQRDDLLASPEDALADTKGHPGDPKVLVPLAADAPALYAQYVRLQTPPPHMVARGAVWRVEAGASLLAAAASFVDGRAAHAHGLGMAEEEVSQLRALHEGCLALVAGGHVAVALAGGVEEAEVVRAEVYGKRDGADGGNHLARKERTGVFRRMGALALFFCMYANGRAFGVAVLLPNGGELLIRAVRVRGEELGMTAFARLVACALGVSLGLGSLPHTPTDVGDVTTDTRVRMVLGA